MRPTHQGRPVFTNKAIAELWKTALNYHQPRQEWRENVRNALTSNSILMRELYRMAHLNPYQVRGLLNECERHVTQAISILQAPERVQQLQQGLNLPPNHPSIINNINHPLNPSNPCNLMVNPAMNLLFQAQEAVEEGILEQEIEESAENDLAADMLTDENLNRAAQEALENIPHLNPHKELGLPTNATQSQIESACLSSLANTASPPGKEHSHEFSKIAAASMLLGFGSEHHASNEKINAASRPLSPALG